MATNEISLSRIWELDFLRGIALILMIYFHIIFDMENIYSFHVSTGGANYFIGKFSAILFILLSGISSMLSRNNTKRALKLLLLAMFITLVTHFYSPELGIKFGILHLLGVCILISPILKKLNRYLLFVFGTSLIALGSYITNISAPNDYFFILGITSNSFSSSDYYPIIPWLGVFLYGLALGKTLYITKRSIFDFNIKNNFVNAAGRHTLLLYMIHQPIIIGLLFLYILT